MDIAKISYIIPSLAPITIQTSITDVRNMFHLNPPQQKQYNDSIITFNTAHVTLKRRFYLKEGVTDEMLISVVDTVIKRPIEIESSALKTFTSEGQENVLVAIIDKTLELQSLHMNVLHAILPYINHANEFEGDAYNPHLSIIYKIPNENIEEVEKYVNSKLLPMKYILDNLYILKNIPGIKRERKVVKAYSFA